MIQLSSTRVFWSGLLVASYIEEEDYQVNEDTPFKDVPSSGGTK